MAERRGNSAIRRANGLACPVVCRSLHAAVTRRLGERGADPRVLERARRDCGCCPTNSPDLDGLAGHHSSPGRARQAGHHCRSDQRWPRGARHRRRMAGQRTCRIRVPTSAGWPASRPLRRGHRGHPSPAQRTHFNRRRPVLPGDRRPVRAKTGPATPAHSGGNGQPTHDASHRSMGRRMEHVG